jgi:DNA-binding NarL/FixJ family response regulator
VIADDNLLVRTGIAALLRDADIEVAAQASTAEEVLREVDLHESDVVIVDIRMPSTTHSDEGLRAARDIRVRHPRTGVVILSEHLETGAATRALVESPERLGYLLKDRVTDVEDFIRTLRHVVGGGSALDPQVVSLARRKSRTRAPLRPGTRQRCFEREAGASITARDARSGRSASAPSGRARRPQAHTKAGAKQAAVRASPARPERASDA